VPPRVTVGVSRPCGPSRLCNAAYLQYYPGPHGCQAETGVDTDIFSVSPATTTFDGPPAACAYHSTHDEHAASRRLQGCRPQAGRLRPTRDPTRRARDARPHGPPRAVRR